MLFPLSPGLSASSRPPRVYREVGGAGEGAENLWQQAVLKACEKKIFLLNLSYCMNEFINKNSRYLLAVIIALAAFLIFFNLTRADIQSDDAIYSFRAIGYLDYVDSINLQPTPLSWFEQLPAWSKLSFHDAPPLVFLIQFLFFKLFGVSVFVSRLPFALAGVGSVILVYFLAKELYNQKIAIAAAFILSILSYHVWASKVGFLEPIALFFVLLTFLIFFKALRQPRYFIWFGVSLGLALLTKYTAFFILPVIFFYLLAKNRRLFFNLYFIAGLVIAFLLFSPVLIYNFQLYQARGHFDLQFSQLFGQDISLDWPQFGASQGPANYLAAAFRVWRELASLISLPLYLLVLLSVFFILGDFIWSWRKGDNLFLILVLFFLTAQFIFIGSEARFLSLFNPFLAIVLALSLVKFSQLFLFHYRWSSWQNLGLVFLVILVFSFELFYNFNTNIFPKAIGQKGKHYSVNRWENTGFKQLENYLIEEVNLTGSEMRVVDSLQDIFVKVPQDLVGKNIVIYDPSLKWFSTLWYFRRWAVYNKQIFISAADLAAMLPVTDWMSKFQEFGSKNMYYVLGVSNSVRGSGSANQKNREAAEILAQGFEAMAVEMKEIYNSDQQLAFKVYKLKLKE